MGRPSSGGLTGTAREPFRLEDKQRHSIFQVWSEDDQEEHREKPGQKQAAVVGLPKLAPDEDRGGAAHERAKIAYGYMIKADPSLKERIQMGEVRAVGAGKEGIPLDVEVRIK